MGVAIPLDCGMSVSLFALVGVGIRSFLLIWGLRGKPLTSGNGVTHCLACYE